MKKSSPKGTRKSPAPSIFPVVGIGASAGGLEAFTQLFKQLPPDTGMAFVIIQHLDPTHTSFLCEALTKTTQMTVSEAADGVTVEPDHVYVIPPNADVAIVKGRLTLVSRVDDKRRPHLPVDTFFRALATDCGVRAIGVVLSGTASDGTEGLKAIKAAEGITFAQDPVEAKFAGMPRSALDAGVVDHCLAIPELATALVRLSHHSYLVAEPTVPVATPAGLKEVFLAVRHAAGVDFSEYKPATFERRLARRMALRGLEDLPAYLELLKKEPDESRLLFEDILIHVTSFFRDPELFETLKRAIFPEILKHKEPDASIRIWVAGCSTGEEVYSLAICLLESLGDSTHPVQIFGTDVSERAIEKARAGIFSDAAMRDVSEERRRRYFSRADRGYRISKTVRDLCVFVQHDLARDPPFSRLDLVSCRNVLIYFGAALQKRVLPTFHYALQEPGFLVLGHSESLGAFGQMFAPIDKTNKIFARTALASTLRFAPSANSNRRDLRAKGASASDGGHAGDLTKHLDGLLLARYAPPGVLVDEKLQILNFRGQTGAFLQPAPGVPKHDMIQMARPGLLAPLRAAIAEAKRSAAPVRREHVEVEQDGVTVSCDLVVLPYVGMPAMKEKLFVVLFEPRDRPPGARKPGPRNPVEQRRLAKLENELSATQEYLRSLNDEHIRATDDLGAANEELISGNEELQSMNEELETAKEELQSTNEELTTVNDELHSRNLEVGQVNSDLTNLVGTVDIPILILDRARRIRRFTPRARSILNVVPADIGRSLGDIRSNLEIPDLDAQIVEVIDTMIVKESEVQDADGHWYRLQIRPYKTIEDKIDGAILSLVDIDALKHLVSEAQKARAEAESANRAKDQFLAVLSHELRSPLSSMLLQAQLLREKDMDAVKIRRASEAIERGTRVQVQLIEDLLDVSRIVNGKLRMENKIVDLCEVVRAAIDGVSASATRKGIAISVALDESIGKVSGDSTRLQQVVSNLLTNAIKFSHERGKVSVGLEIIEGHARLTVVDTGIGIEPAFLPHVFRRFAQEDSSTTRTYGGLGLGLAIVRHIVEAHGGAVQATSPGKGAGATFTVDLPLVAIVRAEDGSAIASGPPVPLSEAARSVPDPGPLRDLRVLIIDDDSVTGDAVADMLQQRGAQIAVTGSAVEARAVVMQFQPDVLVCDIAMPGEDGYAFIRQLRALGPTNGGQIPALALTALATDNDRRRAMAAGFQMHLTKPIDIEHLTRAIGALVTSAQGSIAPHDRTTGTNGTNGANGSNGST